MIVIERHRRWMIEEVLKIRFFTKPVLFCQAASDLPNTLRSEKFWSRILTESLIQLLIVGVAWGLFFMLVDFLGEHLISVFSVTLFISSIGALVYPLYSIIRRGYTLSFDNSSIVVKNVFGIRTKLFRIDSTKILKNSLLPADHGLTEFDNYVFESRGRSICIICESEKDQRLISSFLSGEFNALAIYNASNTKEVKSNETKVSQISRKGKLSLFEDFSKYKLWFIIGLIVLLIGVLVDYRIATKSDIGLNLIAVVSFLFVGITLSFFFGAVTKLLFVKVNPAKISAIVFFAFESLITIILIDCHDVKSRLTVPVYSDPILIKQIVVVNEEFVQALWERFVIQDGISLAEFKNDLSSNTNLQKLIWKKASPDGEVSFKDFQKDLGVSGQQQTPLQPVFLGQNSDKLNEELLVGLYNKYELYKKGTFDEFRRDMQNLDVQERFYYHHELDKKGTFTQFQIDLGVLTARQAEQMKRNSDYILSTNSENVEKVWWYMLSAGQEVGSIDKFINAILDDNNLEKVRSFMEGRGEDVGDFQSFKRYAIGSYEISPLIQSNTEADFNQRLQDIQRRADEKYRAGEGSWLSRIYVQIRIVKIHFMDDVNAMAEMVTKSVGAYESSGNLHFKRVTLAETEGLLRAELPSPVKHKIIAFYVRDFEDGHPIWIEVNSDNRIVNAWDETGYYFPVSMEFIQKYDGSMLFFHKEKKLFGPN
ncbi:MAG: hypothetical protein KDE26_08150 [Bacteroidetes bacterium]|nr:hypothetical protein [Bacteroidota bacterium]MCB9222473.1 hypothetical protein [Ignavibacteria bacterium]